MSGTNKKRSKEIDPLDEGASREIYEHFLKPLIYFKPPELTISEFLVKYVFLSEERSIERYIVKEPFDMPGLLYVTSQRPTQGLGYRHATPGDIMYIREDRKFPDNVDVEWIHGANIIQHFQVSRYWYEWMLIRLKEFEPNPKAKAFKRFY